MGDLRISASETVFRQIDRRRNRLWSFRIFGLGCSEDSFDLHRRFGRAHVGCGIDLRFH